MTPAPSLHELIATVQQDSPTDDPLDLLATASTTVASLSNVSDAVLDHFVMGARSQGRSWAEISSVLGVSKQAAHKRFSAPKADDLTFTFETADFSRFTDRARLTLAAAQQIAMGWGHAYVGTEHLLTALYTQPEGIAARVLADHGVTREAVEGQILGIIPAGEAITDRSHVPFTPRAKSVLKHALTEALSLGHNYIGTEHQLLGIYGEGEGVGAKVLTELGLTAPQAKADIVKHLQAFMKKPEESD
jgi:hypothetical protein